MLVGHTSVQSAANSHTASHINSDNTSMDITHKDNFICQVLLSIQQLIEDQLRDFKPSPDGKRARSSQEKPIMLVQEK
jgi:hypothetical protein